MSERRLTEAFQAYFGLAKEHEDALWARFDLSPRDGEYLSWLWRSDPFRGQRELERFWRRAGDVALIGQAAENAAWAGVQGELRRLRRSLRRSARLAWTGGLLELRGRLGRARCKQQLGDVAGAQADFARYQREFPDEQQR